MSPGPIAVVGAGAGGLCAAKHLLGQGAEVTVFELGPRLGGLWVYENESGRSPAYRSLRINSEAAVTSYRDFPFPDGTPIYPSHGEIADYLEAYADHFDVRRHIRFSTRVEAVELGEGSGWTVRVQDGSETSFDAVVVATGHQAEPAHPEFRERFEGEYLHSHAYRVPEPFRDKRVLVVGTGNSALDVAADISGVTESTTISSRSPVLIMPRMVWGMPVARILAKVEKPWLPWPVARRIRELLTRIVHGSMEQWGFETPKQRTHPASHPSVMALVAWNRIAVRPGVAGVNGSEVRFTDGARESFDSLIAATGYEIDMPFLSRQTSPVIGRRVDLYRRVASPQWPGLYFVGYFNVSGGGNIRMMDIQSRWLAAVIGGRLDLPDEATMRESIEHERRHMAALYPSSPRYGLELDPREYGLQIRADLQGQR